MFRSMSRRQVITDVVIATLFFFVQFSTMFSTSSRNADFGIALVLFSIALGMRRASPALALALAWLGAIVQMAASLDAPQFFDLAALAVLFASASYGGRPLRWIGLGSAVIGAVVATGYLVIHNGMLDTGSTLFSGQVGAFADLPRVIGNSVIVFAGCLVTLGLSWTLGLLARTARRSRESRLAQSLAEQTVVVEQERTRIARDMHDVVAHSLAVVIAQADGARYAREADPDAVDRALGAISTTAREALGDVRILLTQLRDSEGEGPQPVLGDLDRLIDQVRASGLRVVRQDRGSARTLGTGQQLAVYRIVQEALTNALRHGATDHEVALLFDWSSNSLNVTVANELVRGQHPTPNPAGHGLIGMRERASLANGSLATGVDDTRFVVTLTLPANAS